MHAHRQLLPAHTVCQECRHLRIVVGKLRVDDIAVHIHLKAGSRKIRNHFTDRTDHARVHGGTQALEVDAHDELVTGVPRCREGRLVHDVRMGEDEGVTPPPILDLLGGPRGQRDEPVGGRHQDIQLLVVQRVGVVMRVPEIVHRVDERLPELGQRAGHFPELSGALPVEAEVQMDQVEVPGVTAQPPSVKGRWRPPLSGRGGRTDGGVVDAANTGYVRVGEMLNVSQ